VSLGGTLKIIGGKVMSIFDYDTPYMDNTVVGYHGDKVIVKQDDGELFFCEVPNNLILLGETMLPRDLTSISALPIDEQKEIKEKYADSEVY
jgi:hypothetical protein